MEEREMVRMRETEKERKKEMDIITGSENSSLVHHCLLTCVA